MINRLFGLLAALTFACAAPALAQDQTPDRYVRQPVCSVATLDGCAGTRDGNVAVVYDGDSQLDCSDGGGSTRAYCQRVAGTWEPMIPPGKIVDELSICGDTNTINANTVYYGPSATLVANAKRTCDITAAGNTTEATADAPAFTGTAFSVMGMECRQAADAGADISYTLRTAAGATVPSVTCTIPDDSYECTANISTTTDIASGATVAIAAASASAIGANAFRCDLQIVY